MGFVERKNAKIIGVYTNPQPGYAEEELADNHAEVVAFHERAATAFQPRITVTMAQARLALLDAGLLDAVQAAVDAAGGAVKIEWEYRAEVHRDSTLVKTLAAAIGLTDSQVDALFVKGKTF